MRFVGPFSGNGFLPFAALELVQLFFERLGRTLVAIGQVFVHVSHLLRAWLAGQPRANARRALARRRRRKSAAGHAVERVRI